MVPALEARSVDRLLTSHPGDDFAWSIRDFQHYANNGKDDAACGMSAAVAACRCAGAGGGRIGSRIGSRGRTGHSRALQGRDRRRGMGPSQDATRHRSAPRRRPVRDCRAMGRSSHRPNLRHLQARPPVGRARIRRQPDVDAGRVRSIACRDNAGLDRSLEERGVSNDVFVLVPRSHSGKGRILAPRKHRRPRIRRAAHVAGGGTQLRAVGQPRNQSHRSAERTRSDRDAYRNVFGLSRGGRRTHAIRAALFTRRSQIRSDVHRRFDGVQRSARRCALRAAVATSGRLYFPREAGERRGAVQGLQRTHLLGGPDQRQRPVSHAFRLGRREHPGAQGRTRTRPQGRRRARGLGCRREQAGCRRHQGRYARDRRHRRQVASFLDARSGRFCASSRRSR